MIVPIALSLSLLSFLFQAGFAAPRLEARTADGLTAAQQAQFLSLHNSIRAKHSAAALTWNATLANAAEKWSSKCVFQHSGGSLGPYGENLAAGTGAYNVSAAMTSWTNEECKCSHRFKVAQTPLALTGVHSASYVPSNPQPSHYTQIVWKSTKQVGCGLYTCVGGTIFPASYVSYHPVYVTKRSATS